MANPPETTTEPMKITHPDLDATPIITIAPNITVRALQTRDIDSTVTHANNPAIASRMRNHFRYPYTRAHAEEWINKCKDPSTFTATGPFDPETLTGTQAAIPTKYAVCVDDEAVGGVGINVLEDVECRNAEVGYWLGEAYWGQGIMGKVAPEFVKWAWGTFGRLLRIDGYAFEGNPASGRVLEKSGLVWIGRRQKAVFKAGKVLALDCYEMVREDE